MDMQIGDKFISDGGDIIAIKKISTMGEISKLFNIEHLKKEDPNISVYFVSYLNTEEGKMRLKLMSGDSIKQDYAKIIDDPVQAKELLEEYNGHK